MKVSEALQDNPLNKYYQNKFLKIVENAGVGDFDLQNDWKVIRARIQRRFSWNIFGFFGSIFWGIYRRVPHAILLLSVVTVLQTIGALYFPTSTLMTGATYGIGIGAFYGLSGNSCLLIKYLDLKRRYSDARIVEDECRPNPVLLLIPLATALLVTVVNIRLNPTVGGVQDQSGVLSGVTETSSRRTFPVASNFYDLEIVSLDGQDGPSAKMVGMATARSIEPFCKSDPGGETIANGGTLTVEQCVNKYLSRDSAPQTVLADCINGELVSTSHDRYFVTVSDNNDPEFVDEETMQPLNGSSASNEAALVAQYKLLCPSVKPKPRLTSAEPDLGGSWKIDKATVQECGGFGTLTLQQDGKVFDEGLEGKWRLTGKTLKLTYREFEMGDDEAAQNGPLSTKLGTITYADTETFKIAWNESGLYSDSKSETYKRCSAADLGQANTIHEISGHGGE